jgi:hypothetical protein
MTTVHYDAGTHRLRLEGVWRDGDRATIREALDTFAPLAGRYFIVDLTAVTEVDQVFANDLVAAARAAVSEDDTLTFVRKHGTPVDDALTAAEANSTREPGAG